MTYSTVLSALGGGVLIGLAAALLLFFNNRTAGISGIAAGILPPWQQDTGWGGYGFWLDSSSARRYGGCSAAACIFRLMHR